MCRMLLPSHTSTTTLIIIILILTISCSVVNVVTGHRDTNNDNDDDDVIVNENDLDGGHHREPAANDGKKEPLKLYGTEVSWPMQQQQQQLPPSQSTTTASFMTNTIGTKYPTYYVEFMNGCYETYDIPTCHYHDAIRIQRNDIQPKMVHKNFTHAGYAKVVAPMTTFHILREYWDRYSTSHLQFEHENNDDGSSSRRRMPSKMENVNMHMNHWLAPTKILYLDPPTSLTQRHPTTGMSSTSSVSAVLPQMSTSNIHTMIEQIQSVLEQWTGVPLQFTSVYGIRSYTNHSILTPHIDRIPLVISAIVNVAQHVNDDWVLELIGHDGYATNLTMQPGEMIIYESHSIIHGRPYPLNGQYYANCFFHYEPIGYSEQYCANLERRRRLRDPLSPPISTSGEGDNNRFITVKTTQEKYEAALAKLERNEHESTSQAISTESVTPPEQTKTAIPIPLPYYISEGTIKAQRWRQEFEFHRVTLRHESVDDFDEELFPKIIPKKNLVGNTVGATSAHILAARNDIARLRQVARTDPKSLDTPDINGWLPLHEAARGGCTEAVKFLVETYRVADINARTNAGEGGTALWWAEQLPENHEVIQILKRNGAISIAPFQKKKNVGTLKTDDAQSENDMSDVDEEEQVEE